MRSRLLTVATGTALAAGLAIGLARLRLDVDVFQLLPRDAPMVAGLELYQRSFGASRELIVTLRSADAEATRRAAGALAEALVEANLATRVIWRNPLRDDPEDLAEVLAFLWLNQPPDAVAELAYRFVDEQLPRTLEAALERMATSFRPEDVARLGQDPFALTAVLDRLEGSLPGGSEDPFASADGSYRILFVPYSEGDAGFFTLRRWVADVEAFVDTWSTTAVPFDDSGEPLVARVTGNPAFVAETGSGLLRDLQLAAIGTLCLVASLFWWAHRRWAPLGWLACLLILVLALTATVGGGLLGSLNMISLGFAAILLGLAADYGLILSQELVSHPRRDLRQHRAAVAPSILWAAATTAGAFLMISRSSLPGLTQLASLVAIGILTAAAVMLTVFLPPLARRAAGGRDASSAELATAAVRPNGRKSLLDLQPRAAWWLTGLAAGGAVAILAVRLPQVDYSTRQLGPRDGQARAALQEMRDELGNLDRVLWVIVAGKEENEVAERLRDTDRRLEAAVREGLLQSYSLPLALWPQPRLQASNRAQLLALGERSERARQAALDAGFSPEATRLTTATLAVWRGISSDTAAAWPTRPKNRWLLRQFVASEADGLLALGRARPAAGIDNRQLVALATRLGTVDGARMVSWSLLSESLFGLIGRDMRRVVVPTGLVLVLFLGLAFRRPFEVLLSLSALAFSVTCLLATMTLLGWSWNLMNVMALPLLLGAGVDYSIHIQLALRRYRGDVARVRRTVGRAILLCSASTAAGFGTLAFASNAGLISLGRLCAVGVAVAGLVAVYLLPVWWRALAPPCHATAIGDSQ